ncbi:MAG: hypothetical protein HQL72_10755 [Magnetococcales bacterium]|nr:hypothetical protein [Magnetococcales bacterium]
MKRKRKSVSIDAIDLDTIEPEMLIQLKKRIERTLARKHKKKRLAILENITQKASGRGINLNDFFIGSALYQKNRGSPANSK